jgi:trimeric autotransporter adhesin
MSGSAIITTVVGSAEVGYVDDGQQAAHATLFNPYGVTVDSSGNLYIADAGNKRIRMVPKSSGIITTLAGTWGHFFQGGDFYGVDGGPATSITLYYPTSVTVDASGNLYIADVVIHRIRMVSNSSGIITTVAGNGTMGYSGDGGPAISATLSYPRSVTLDASENLYIADSYNSCIRKVSKSSGIITTVAGTGMSGYSGDGGLATSAALSYPRGVTVDASGNLYIADTYNGRIRKVSKSSGIITTVAGTKDGAFSGDGGPATSARLYAPSGVTLDALGNLYIADTYNNRIRMVSESSGIITTVAGTGTYNYSGDGGLATSATLFHPSGVTVDASGNLYIADFGNSRIRMISLTSAPSASPAPSSTASLLPSVQPSLSQSTSPRKSPSISPSGSPLPASTSPGKNGDDGNSMSSCFCPCSDLTVTYSYHI